MEENRRCPVIKNMTAELNSSYEDTNYLKKKVGYFPTEDTFSPSMISAATPPKMLLSNNNNSASEIQQHRRQPHSNFPFHHSRIYKDMDFTRMFPPLRFDNILNSNPLTIQPPLLTSPKLRNQLPMPNLKHHQQEQCNEPVIKKPKFDFSIKALTAKDDLKKEINRRPLGLLQQHYSNNVNSDTNIFSSPPPPTLPPQPTFGNNFYYSNSPPISFTNHEDKENKDGFSPASVKSRGRPSADLIEILKQRSMQSPHRYSCPVCHRSFPRKKSLDTHRLTHSDVKPYPCDFPGCNRRFKQSGQLKTHLRLHTGEKPFKCTYPTCDSAFTHANRKCAQHPEFPLRRISTDALSEDILRNISNDNSTNAENLDKIKQWFEKHFSNKDSQNTDNKENIIIETNYSNIKFEATDIIDHSDSASQRGHSEENNKRLLSAVALVELQMKNPLNRKENYAELFNTRTDL